MRELKTRIEEMIIMIREEQEKIKNKNISDTTNNVLQYANKISSLLDDLNKLEYAADDVVFRINNIIIFLEDK